MRYGLNGKARTRPDFFKVVLGPCALGEKMGPFTKNLAEMGSKFFGGLNQKCESVSFSGI